MLCRFDAESASTLHERAVFCFQGSLDPTIPRNWINIVRGSTSLGSLVQNAGRYDVDSNPSSIPIMSAVPLLLYSFLGRG